VSKWSPLYLKLSVIISVLLPMFIPSNPIIGGGIIKYNYGFPFTYATIYQREITSAWFFENFFTGNAGLLINPLTAIVNVIALYYAIWYLAKVFSKIQKRINLDLSQ
jgi:hypothetical protein